MSIIDFDFSEQPGDDSRCRIDAKLDPYLYFTEAEDCPVVPERTLEPCFPTSTHLRVVILTFVAAVSQQIRGRHL